MRASTLQGEILLHSAFPRCPRRPYSSGRIPIGLRGRLKAIFVQGRARCDGSWISVAVLELEQLSLPRTWPATKSSWLTSMKGLCSWRG